MKFFFKTSLKILYKYMYILIRTIRKIIGFKVMLNNVISEILTLPQSYPTTYNAASDLC